MERVKGKSVGWALYWVGYALSFGMLIAEVPDVETFLDGSLYFVLTLILSFGSWVGVGVALVGLMKG